MGVISRIRFPTWVLEYIFSQVVVSNCLVELGDCVLNCIVELGGMSIVEYSVEVYSLE